MFLSQSTFLLTIFLSGEHKLQNGRVAQLAINWYCVGSNQHDGPSPGVGDGPFSFFLIPIFFLFFRSWAFQTDNDVGWANSVH